MYSLKRLLAHIIEDVPIHIYYGPVLTQIVKFHLVSGSHPGSSAYDLPIEVHIPYNSMYHAIPVLIYVVLGIQQGKFW